VVYIVALINNTIGAIIMKISLVALVAGCAFASSAFSMSDSPKGGTTMDSPPSLPPRAAVLDSPPSLPPRAAVLDSPPSLPPRQI
jgi:hypothetical protein